MTKIERQTHLVCKYLIAMGYLIKPLVPSEWDECGDTTNGGFVIKIHTVYLRCGMDPLKKFYVLLHEAGHVLAHEAGFGNHPNQMAERQAYFGGSLLATSLGLDIDWAEWRRFNWEAKIPR
jgi:hypothetical protein